MKNYLRSLLSGTIVSVIAFLSFFGINLVEKVEPTPMENRVYTDSEMSVTPETDKHIKVTVLDEGKNIFNPSENSSAGYRYGPSIFVNKDNSIDAFFAAPGAYGQWDWITYKHSPDGGVTWTDEKKVLGPTAGSDDFYSTCDPGAIKFGDYYYIGYTSTVDVRGVYNQVFVARSKNINGPYEKWNGNGWGGNPKAIVSYDENLDCWGAGEPSFICIGDKLMIYYTWKSVDSNGQAVNQTRVSVADATDENWPATMEYKGVSINYADMSCDSADVKYIDDYGKFVAISTSSRLSENSYVSIYESNDGISFSKVNDLKTHISYFCHNSGLSSRPNGHIRLSDKKYLGYAYGPKWGVWATRIHEINYSLTDIADFSDSLNSNSKNDVVFSKSKLIENYVAISDEGRVYNCKKGGIGFSVKICKTADTLLSSRVFCGVKFSGYDKNIVKIVCGRVIPVGIGSTHVTAEWHGLTTEFLVNVN